MIFSTVVGNPPYQLMDDGHGASAKPIYHHFVQDAKKMRPDIICMVIPARWYSGGKGKEIVEFRHQMVNDKHLERIDDFKNSQDCFDDVDIKGGICYFLRNEKYISDNCRFVSHIRTNIVSDIMRPLMIPGTSAIIRYNEAITILNKVKNKCFYKFNVLVGSRKPFGLDTTFNNIVPVKDENHTVYIYSRNKQGYVSENEIIKNIDWKDKYKIYIPEAIGIGDMSKYILKPIIGYPYTICTETYIIWNRNVFLLFPFLLSKYHHQTFLHF